MLVFSGMPTYAERFSPYLEQLQEGTLKVRDALGPDIIVTDKEIQDSLWHYYYDIGKTVTWILSKPLHTEIQRIKLTVFDDQRTAPQPGKVKKPTNHASSKSEHKINGSYVRSIFPQVISFTT